MEKKMSIIEYLIKNRCRNITMTSENRNRYEMSINFEINKDEFEEIEKNALGKPNHSYLLNEYKEKIKLTKDEFIILKNIDEEYQWIARDINGTLYVYKNKPFKDGAMWSDGERSVRIELFEHLFKFIKFVDEKPTNIKELLNNYEVIEK